MIRFLPFLLLVSSQTYAMCWENLTVKEHGECIVINSLRGKFGGKMRLYSEQRNPEFCIEAQRQMDTMGRQMPPPKGTVLDRLIVVTHQTSRMQDATADLLSSPRFRDTPSVILASPGFHVDSKKLAEQASFFVFSQGGEMERHPYVARDVTFVGGCGSWCLPVSVRSVVEEAELRGMKEITLRFLQSYIYAYSARMEKIIAAQYAVTKETYFDELKGNMLIEIHNSLIRDDSSLSETSSGFTGTYKREKSGLILHIEVEK